MARAISIRVKGGHVATGSQLRSAVEQAMTTAIRRGGMVYVSEGMRASPVGPTGNLRRSWAIKPASGGLLRDGNRIYVQVGPNIIYARRVNLTSRKNKGYIQRGQSAARPQAAREIGRGIGELKSRLWIRG